MRVLLNLQGLHSRSYFLLVILLSIGVIFARLWLLLCSPSYRLHTSIFQTSTITSLCATESTDPTARKVVVFLITREKWRYFWLATDIPSGFSPGPVLFNRYIHLSIIRMEEVNTPLPSLLVVADWEVMLTLLRDKMPCRRM